MLTLNRVDDIRPNFLSSSSVEIKALEGNQRVVTLAKVITERAIGGKGGDDIRIFRGHFFRVCNDFIDTGRRTSYMIQIIRAGKWREEEEGEERIRGERKLREVLENVIGDMQVEVREGGEEGLMRDLWKLLNKQGH